MKNNCENCNGLVYLKGGAQCCVFNIEIIDYKVGETCEEFIKGNNPLNGLRGVGIPKNLEEIGLHNKYRLKEIKEKAVKENKFNTKYL
jgi:hypothetical protein